VSSILKGLGDELGDELGVGLLRIRYSLVWLTFVIRIRHPQLPTNILFIRICWIRAERINIRYLQRIIFIILLSNQMMKNLILSLLSVNCIVY
jgi:hypothetical protein